MKSIFLDTDVLLDFLMQRASFFEQSKQIVQNCANGKFAIFMSPLSLSNCFYFLRKVHGTSKSIELLKRVVRICEIVGMHRSTIVSALDSNFSDFEDALQHYSALENGTIDAIVTRNVVDYRTSTLPVFTPTEFLAAFSTRS